MLALATLALWLLARPGGDRRWKLAASSALIAAGLALLTDRLIGTIWYRQRPFLSDPSAHVWGGRSGDPSFPSDHASAAFAIGFAIFLFSRLAGSLFLAAALVIGAGRVVVGAHYPFDVVAGCLVGLGAALLVARLARPLLAPVVSLLERVTDPLDALLRRARKPTLRRRP